MHVTRSIMDCGSFIGISSKNLSQTTISCGTKGCFVLYYFDY